MKKIAYAFVVFLIVAAAGYFYVLPQLFHSKIHTALIPLMSGSKTIVYDEAQHQTVLQDENSTITITSFDDLNPLAYHVEAQYKHHKKPRIHTAKVFPALSAKELGLKVVFENFVAKDQKGKLATSNVVLNFTTPLSKALLTHWKDPKYFITNAKAQFSLGELHISSDKNSLILKDMTAAINLTSGETNNLVITNDIKFDEFSVTMDGKNTISKDLTSHLAFDSINKSGVMEGFKQITKKDAPGGMMGAVEHLKHFVNYPFNVKMNGNSTSSEGDIAVETNIVMNEFNMAKLKDFIKADLTGTFPKKFMEEALLERVVAMTVDRVGSMFFSPDVPLPSSTENKLEQTKLAKQHETKLSEAVKAILTDTTTGESKIQSLLKDLVQNKLIEQTSNSYTIKATVANMSIQLNGQDAMSVAAPLLMKIDVSQELLAKGFVVSSTTPSPDGRMPASVPVASPQK